MATNKKTAAKVRDMKPSKDAKGGKSKYLAGRTPAVHTASNRAVASRAIAGRTLH